MNEELDELAKSVKGSLSDVQIEQGTIKVKLNNQNPSQDIDGHVESSRLIDISVKRPELYEIDFRMRQLSTIERNFKLL